MAHQRRRSRRSLRRIPHRGILRADRSPSPQPRRQPTSQPRPLADRHGPPHLRPATRAYLQRRRAESRTTREITRCLKRYIAREIYRLLTNPPVIQDRSDLRQTRTAAGITLATAAKALNTWPARISEIERGIRPAPERTHRYRLWLGLTAA